MSRRLKLSRPTAAQLRAAPRALAGSDFVRKVGQTLTVRFLQVASAFAGTVATARFLGPDARGDYFLVVTLTLVIVQFANLGLQSSNTYYVAGDRRLLAPLVANSAWVSLAVGGGGAVAAVTVLRASHLVTMADPSLLWFAVALAPAILFFALATNLLVGTLQVTLFNVVEAVSNIGVALALVGAGLAAFRAPGFLAMSAGAWSVASAVLLVVLVRQGGGRLRFRMDVFAGGFRYAAKSYVVTALGFLVLRSNVFVLHHYYGARELGFYSVAAQVGDAIALLPASVALILFPRLVQSATARWQSTVRSAIVVAAILVVICGVAAIAAEPFTRLAFGPAYIPAAAVLRLMLPGVAALGTATIFSQFLASIGVPRTLVLVWLVALGLVLGTGRLLVPHHAGAGAAAALSLTYGVLLVLVAGLAYRHRHDRSEPQGPSPEMTEPALQAGME